MEQTEENLVNNNTKLEQSLQDLNDIQNELFRLIYEQDETIDNIQNNMSKTELTMEEGRKELEIAQSYYFRYTPILLGAVLGGISLGPVGMLLNVKFGSMFTLGGGILGGYGGYKIQK
jgi:hypothetical protein